MKDGGKYEDYKKIFTLKITKLFLEFNKTIFFLSKIKLGILFLEDKQKNIK